ncbi:MAG TPA: DUF2203 family protein [Planctomycetaceae bacterium]|jgi:hypothetical protein|nr:DUF2203 family protein [Planctomycetaceae bacterium]
MKKQRKSKTAAVVTLRLWTYSGAQKVVPYLRSVVQSLRDGWLDLRQAQEQLKRSEAYPGRPDRDTLIRLEESRREIARVEARVEETMHEMLVLSAYTLDPVAGLAVIPFVQGEGLAWFVFDLFDPQGLVAWRMHTDPLEMRRSLAELPVSQTTADSAAIPAVELRPEDNSRPSPGAQA